MKKLEQTITSLEIAEMMKVQHFEVLKKLEGAKDRKGIIQILSDNQMSVAEYFQESTYEDAQGKQRKCYKVTKLGCDFLANKFTGEKGILFTAKYVKRFHEMEEIITKPTCMEDILIFNLQEMKAVKEKVETVDNDLQTFKQDMPILGIEESRITNAVRSKGVKCLGGKDSNAYKDKSIRGKVYSDIYGQLRREFGVNTYKAIKRSQCDLSISIIENYEMPLYIAEIVKDCNRQINFGETA